MEDAPSVASAVAYAERSIRSDQTPPLFHDILGRTHQLAYRKLVANTEWREPAIALLDADLKQAARLHIEAGEKLRSLTKPVEKIPDWKIVAPPPAPELRSYYDAAEAEFGIGWQYLAAVHLVETRMGRIRGTSSAGAQGPMQFLPSTWEAYGEGDINSPKDSIRAAARYLDRNGGPEDMRKALYRYNPTYKYVDAVEIYAKQMIADARMYNAYYNWQVFVRTTQGDVLLEIGYGAS